jgi:hypothetical protein
MAAVQRACLYAIEESGNYLVLSVHSFTLSGRQALTAKEKLGGCGIIAFVIGFTWSGGSPFRGRRSCRRSGS